MTNVREFARGAAPSIESIDYMGTGVRVRLQTLPPGSRRAFRAGDSWEAQYFDAFVRTAAPSRRRRQRWSIAFIRLPDIGPRPPHMRRSA